MPTPEANAKYQGGGFMKILLVEDSAIQINWAKKELEEHELVIAVNASEALSALKNDTFDIVLTDLVMPGGFPLDPDLRDQNDTPQAFHGWNIFRKILQMHMKGEIKGIALVSNFEHHLEKGDDIGHYVTMSKAIAQTGWEVEDYSGALSFKRSLRSLNIISFLDALTWSAFPAAIIEGELSSPADISAGWQHQKKDSMWSAMQNGNITLLKPFKKIVEALSQEL
jgi:CheY-like chemotaxis protein